MGGYNYGAQQQQQPYPGAGPMMQVPGAMGGATPPKPFIVTLLLCIFAGTLGAHRFYTGHIVPGLIQLFTLGGCGVWWAIDLFMIVTGKYTDSEGRPLIKES
jgi:hypothetical protein